MRRQGWLIAGMLAWAVVASACASPSASSPVPVEERVTGRRDLEALQRLAQHPRACTEDASCPIGSHCDPDSDTCRWACLADSECGTGRRCSLRGSCVAAGRARLANDTAGCEAIPAADRRAALIALDDDAQQGSFITCDSDETCPCGSHCSEDAVCQVACLSDQPTPGLTCGVGLACTALGRCATAATDPGPPLALTLSLSESITTANTAAAPVVMPLTITVDAIGLDVLTATTGASVKLTIAEVRDFDQGRAAAAPKLAPRVKCAAGDPLASSCEIAGGWTFVVSSGRLRSAPHQIWVEIPQSTTAQDWTLEARSEWAADPARDVVRAAPVIIPATDPGHYKGTMLVPNEGAATVADQTLVLPIEAIVTPTHVVVLEPTRLILPDGQVVFSRAETKSTLLAWLTTTGASYDVSLHLADFSYSAADGHLDASIELATGAATPVTTLYLALERSGDVDAPACPCTAGFYCHAALARCLPGSAPPAGGGIVDTVSALPSSALPSAKLAPWVAPLASAVAGASALLGGAETAGIERAYCFEAITQPGAAHLGVTLQSVSGDLSCMQGGASTTEYAQTTFAFENLDRELDPGTAGGDAFDLFETCVGDLTAQPTGPATASNLLGSKACTSLGRFFLAITANASGGVGQALPDTGQRLVDHVLRQWLGVHAYVASTAVQTRRYDDALSISSAPAQEQLGSAVDLVDAGLRVLLDPRVRPQYATGAGLQLAMTEPDYRLALRPVARWTFNGLASPVPDVEGNAALTATGVDLSSAELYAHGSPGTQTCGTTQPVALEDRRFTIMANLGFTPLAGSTTVLFDKLAPSGDRLWIEATQAATGVGMKLVLKDSRGGVATFAGVDAGLVAVVAAGSDYRIYQAPTGLPVTQTVATSVVNGGPRWGAPGPVRLACDLPLATNTCTSWDRNTVGDGLDVHVRAPYVEHAATWRYACTEQTLPPFQTSCPGPAPTAATCTTAAAARRTQLIQGLFANPPAAAVNALGVQGTLVEVDSGIETHPKFVIDWTDYRCDYAVTNRPDPVTTAKPVCGTAPQAMHWDEISLWSRPVQLDEFGAMAARYNNTKVLESLPPRPTAPLAGKEQAVALPVHILEAASADLELLAQYVEAERGVMYEECYLGGASPARDRVAARAGSNVRLIAILEREAQHLAGLPGGASTAWFARYEAAHRQLAGRRAKLLQEIKLAGECRNPLGISEADLPLYVGEEVGASGKFFASSRFLTSKAHEEISLAAGKLGSAQAAYVQQREAAYQLNAARDSKVLRETKLRADIESSLLRYCGKPAGSQKLLDGFLAGTQTPDNCFLKTEVPACVTAAAGSLAELPATCLRGDIGARLLAIQAAGIDMANASASLVRATEQYDGDMVYCGRRQEAFDETEQILALHYAHMQSLRAEEATTNNFLGIPTGILHLDVRGVVTSVSGLAHSLGINLGFQSNELQQQKENDDNQAVLEARSHDLDIAECYHRVDNEKFTIDAARDVITRGVQAVATAVFGLDNDNNELLGLIDEAAGQLAVEAGIDGTPPHLHFWLDQDISDYQRHLEYARRLTYLALRAFEYEAQQTIGHRGETLTARRPEDLLAVVTAIEQRNAPMQGELGLVIGARPVVLSLRDEILQFLDLARTTHPLPGDPPVTPEQAFKRFLASESAKILDSNGRFIGRGIRFSLHPAAWTETSCAERIWRITPSLQIDNPPTQHGLVLYQENAFGSQDCRADFGTVTLSRADASANLLAGDTASFATPSSSTALNIDGPLGLDHETLRARSEGDIAGLAGRGLYANYVLLFPSQTWSDAEVAKVKDLLIRFDIVEITHASPL